MIVCAKCKQVIYNEMEESEAGPIHPGNCPNVLVTKADLEPFGKGVPVRRNEINLSDQQMGAIELISQALYNTNSDITFDAIIKMWPDDDERFAGSKPVRLHAEKYLRSNAFLANMATRGVRLAAMEHQLTSEQFALIELMRNPEGRRMSVIMKRAGVTKSKFNSWMQQPAFQTHFKTMVGDNTQQALLLSEISLADKAADGDINATKFLWEFTEKYNSQKNSNQTDAMDLVHIILDAVQNEVNDPAVLERIKQRVQFKATGLRGAM